MYKNGEQGRGRERRAVKSGGCVSLVELVDDGRDGLSVLV